MFIISVLISLFLVSVLIVAPLILLGCGKMYKVRNVSFNNALLTGIIILLVGGAFDLLSFFLHTESIPIKIVFAIFSLSIAIWILKKRFDTNVLRATGIYFTSLVFSVIIAVVLALSIRTFVVQAFKIPSGAMLDTVQIGDQILVNKCIYKFKSPERGDIVVLKYPLDPTRDYLERIVAIGGDVIEIKNKELYINDLMADEAYVVHYGNRVLSPDSSPRDNFGPVTVPANSYFVMGDNRDNSRDSRFWGFVESKYIKGKAFMIYWSFDKENEMLRAERIGMPL